MSDEPLPEPDVVSCHFDAGFTPPLAAMFLSWRGARPREWDLPGGVCRFGPPPVRFGLHVRRLTEERYAVRLVWDELGQWRLWLTDGSEWDVHLEGDSFVSPEVMILNFSSGQRRFHWVVLSDVLDGDTRRRLRVRLRLDRLNTDPAGDLANSGK